MSERIEPKIAAAEHGAHRFDGDTVRRILERGAREQHRLNTALADSYSLEELQEMAAEARISPEALRAAIESDRAAKDDRIRAHDTGLRGGGNAGHGGRQGVLAAFASWIPGRTPAARSWVLTSTGGIALVGLLLAFPALAEALFWAILLSLLVLSVLVLLGASPF